MGVWMLEVGIWMIGESESYSVVMWMGFKS